MLTSLGLGPENDVPGANGMGNSATGSRSGGGSILAILSGFFHPSFLSWWLPDFIIGNYRWMFRMIESWSTEYHANNQFVVRMLYYATSMILLLDYTPHRMHDECKESSYESHKRVGKIHFRVNFTSWENSKNSLPMIFLSYVTLFMPTKCKKQKESYCRNQKISSELTWCQEHEIYVTFRRGLTRPRHSLQ